jgi:hypothetical protein
MSSLQQEIINSQGRLDSVDSEGFKVLNMLNTRWIIMPAQDGSTLPVLNPHAMGNAWFVDEVVYVDSADEEIEALSSLDLRKVAVADRQYEPLLAGYKPTPADTASTILLTEYDSDYLTYSVDAKKEELAVFSEIYYPRGWQITIDGEPAEMMRVNYTLRALPVPAGKHTILFRFDPQSVKITDTVAYFALAIMLLTAIFLIYKTFYRSHQQRKTPH